MPTPIRVLLETLSPDRLRRLIELRDLRTSRSSADKAETLARSYRGDYEQLVCDVALEDLKTFAEYGPGRARLGFELQGWTRASRSQLEKAIVNVFAQDWQPKRDGDTVPWTGGIWASITQDDSEVDDDVDDEDEGDVLEDDDDASDEVAAGDTARERTPFWDIGADWSRPQLLRRVVQKVLGVRLSRLRTARFQELLAALRAVGLEASTVSGELLGESAVSPGIEVKVRLRRPGPPVVQSGPRIEIVNTGSRGWTVTPLPPYEAALRRLKLLTAVPDDARASLPDLLSEFVMTAAAGLPLTAAERSLLGNVAKGLAKGTHSPLAAAQELSRHTEEHTWTWLLAEMVRLNPHHEVVAIHTVAAIRAHVRGVPPQEPDGRTAIGSDPPTEPTAPVRSPTPPPKQVPAAPVAAGPTTNVRSLGDLDDMLFK